MVNIHLPSLKNIKSNKVNLKHLTYRTQSANDATVTHDWLIIDAEDKTLGRLSTRIATLLMGKHKPYFTNHTDCGDHVIVINAEKIRLTGNKINDKLIVTYSGYPGGKKTTTPKKLLQKKPTQLLENAVHGMLPKTKLGAQIFGKLHLYAGAEHPHAAQKPKQVK